MATLRWAPRAGGAAAIAAVALLLTVGHAAAQTVPKLSSGSAVSTAANTVTPGTSNSFVNSTEDGQRCTTVTFEGLANQAPVPAIQGINFTNWLSLIDGDAGGNGNFANEPSPQTIMFWLTGSPSITLDNPASKVEFYYTTAAALSVTAFDADNNQIAQIARPVNYNVGCSGDPNGTFCRWDLLTVAVPGKKIKRFDVGGGQNLTGFDNLKVCGSIAIEAVELTQAIQQYQKIDDLKADLQPDREPPVPIIEGKPAALRVYLEKVPSTTTVRIDVSGAVTGSETLTIQPQCTPEQRRLKTGGCLSTDFYFTPPSGNFDIKVAVKDTSGNVLEEHDLPFKSRSTNKLKVKAVSVCDSKDAAGAWLCEGGAAVANQLEILRRIAPTKEVTADVGARDVKRDIATSATPRQWWTDMVGDLADMHSIFDSALEIFGTTTRYYGMVRDGVAGNLLGLANGIPGFAAASLVGATDMGVNIAPETVAHELGHTLGLRHTNNGAPSSATPPGCASIAGDANTDWPFADSRVQSTARLEVGFDVVAKKALDPQNTFEIMGYCMPQWVAPQRYKTMITALSGGAVTSASNVGPRAVSAVVGPFLLVSGVILNGSIEFNPLFEFGQGPETSDGTHRVQVLDGGDNVMVERFFTPFTAILEDRETEDAGPPQFSLLVPKPLGAAKIVVRSPANQILGTIVLGGVAPIANLTSPAPPANLTGSVNVQWSIIDSDSSSHTTRLHYSRDNGATWSELGVTTAQNLVIDADSLPGSTQALLRLIVSDGVNSGTSDFGPYTVPKKATVEATILAPDAGSVFPPGKAVFLEGLGLDVDDGVLTGASLVWTSNLSGALGTGELVEATLPTGAHTIKLVATDSDGNKGEATRQIVIAGAPPVISLSTRAFDSLPTTCVEATIGVQSPGLPASLVEYSLDGGENWTNIPLNQLPARFIAPGSGFFHLIARAFDAAEQSDAKSEQFFTSAPCMSGTPKLGVRIVDRRWDSQGQKYFVDLEFRNTGEGVAKGVRIDTLKVTPIGGGTASIHPDTRSLPILVGDIAVGAARTVGVWVELKGVTRFTLSESGALTDALGARAMKFSFSQSVIPGPPPSP